MLRAACHQRASAPPGRRVFQVPVGFVRSLGPGLLLTLLAAGPLRAQSLVDPILPSGTLGLNVLPSYTTWSAWYGPQGLQPLGAELTSANAASLFPGVSTLEQDLRGLTGSATGFPSILGPVAARVSEAVDRVELGARLGVFDWLTVGFTVPFVRNQTPIDVYFRSDTVDGNIGLSPIGNAGVASLLSGLTGAAAAARSRATSVCSGSPGTSACTSATALAQRVSSFAEQAHSAYYASPFFPLQGSLAATALTNALSSLNQDLAGAGLAPVQVPFVFSSQRLDSATFNQLPANASAGILTSPLQTVDGLWQLGDIEVSAMARLLHGEVRDSGASQPLVAWELAGGGLVRLGTGHAPNPSVLYDVGSGDGLTTLEARVYGSLRFGRHFEVRSAAQYGAPRSGVQLRRVAPPGTLLAPYSSVEPVRWSPGTYLNVEVSPRWYLTQGLSLTLDYDAYAKAADHYTAVPTSQGGDSTLDVSVLDRETAMSLRTVGFGLTYSTLQAARAGRTWLPTELDARFIQAIGGSGGRAPRIQEFQLAAHVYARLWGGS